MKILSQPTCLPQTKVLSIPLDNSTGTPKDYLLFADNRQVVEASASAPPLPNFPDISALMSQLKDVHDFMSTDFQNLQNEQNAAITGARAPVFDFVPLVNHMATAALHFIDLRNEFATLTGGGAPTLVTPSMVAQLAKEVAKAPIKVKRITLYTNRIAQLSQNYTVTKSLILRDSEDNLLKFNTQYSSKDLQPIATLEGKDLGNLIFDSFCGLQFTVLPNTNLTIELEYEIVPIQVCYESAKQAIEVETETETKIETQNPTPKNDLPASSKQTAPAPKKEPQKWIVGFLGLLLLLIVLWLTWRK